MICTQAAVRRPGRWVSYREVTVLSLVIGLRHSLLRRTDHRESIFSSGFLMTSVNKAQLCTPPCVFVREWERDDESAAWRLRHHALSAYGEGQV